MPYVIKRYANRKLYDTRTKRYLTLDEVAVLVRAGEDVRVEDADTGDDLTAQILAKIVAEGHRKGGGSLLVPPKMLVDLIQHSGETVMGAVRTSVSAGQRTVEQMGGEVGRLFESVRGRGDASAAIASLGLPTREEFERLSARVTALEAKTKRTQAGSKRPAARAKARTRK